MSDINKGYITDPSQDHEEWSGREAGEDVTKAIALLQAAQNLMEQAKVTLGRPSERGARCSECGSRNFDWTERKLHQTQSSVNSQIDRIENAVKWLAEVKETRTQGDQQ